MIIFRNATIHDLELLKYWDTQQHVIDSDPDDDWEWETELKRNPPWREQLVAELAGTPIGFVQIIDPYEEETHYWGKVDKNLRAIDIWIGEEANLNKGYGTQMMQLAIKKCFDHPKVTKILIDPLASNVKAHRFYKRLGFEFVEKTTLGDTVVYIFELHKSNI